MKKGFVLLLISLSLLVLGGCFGSDKDSDKTTSTTGTLKISITDAPIDNAEAVNIIFTKIQIKKGSDTGDSGWITYFESTTGKALDLLQFRNGTVSPFDSKVLEAGDYGQIRIFLATTGNSITTSGGAVSPLEYNSGVANNGLKLVGGFSIKAGVETKLTIDFDVRKSIVVKNGKKDGYYLKPTARLISNDVSGAITVNASTTGAVYYLYNGGFNVTSESAIVITNEDTTTESAMFFNAVSSSISSGTTPTAVFAFIPFGTYDIYVYDESEATMLKTVTTGASISANNSSIIVP